MGQEMGEMGRMGAMLCGRKRGEFRDGNDTTPKVIQLQIMAGRRAGALFNLTKLPVLVGRDPAADVFLDEAGVWPRHLRISWQPEGLVCQAEKDAILRINNEPVEQAVLRSGDVISIGAIKIRFALSPVRQSSLRVREFCIWLAMGVICLGQVALIYRLLR